jgi:hypothetical protein
VGSDSFTYDVTAYGPNSTASPGVSTAATVTVNVAPTPPVVNVQNVSTGTNKRGMVTQLDVTFSGPVNSSQADKTKIYRLVYPNKEGAVPAGNASSFRLRSANYNTATDSLTLTLAKPLALKARALDLVIDGTSPSGLEDIVGRYLDGADDGEPGSDAVVSISRSGVSIE